MKISHIERISDGIYIHCPLDRIRLLDPNPFHYHHDRTRKRTGKNSSLCPAQCTTLYPITSIASYLLNKTNLNNPITRNSQIRHLRPRVFSHPQKRL